MDLPITFIKAAGADPPKKFARALKLRILGAAREVGRSALLVEDLGQRIILDYGVLVGNGRKKDPEFPVHVRPKDIDAVFVTHAHLDHSGAVPLFKISEFDGGIFATRPTIQLSELLLYDFLQISGEKLPYTEYEVDAFAREASEVNYGDTVRIGDLGVSVLDAGHIPGSSMFYVEGSERVLYTGDVNRRDTALVKGYGKDLPEADVVVSESTYSQVNHPRREDEERAFVEFAKEVIEREGTLLVPAFAVGRAQEAAMILWRYGFPYPIYMDGMALTVNSILLSNPEHLRDYRDLERALDNVEYVRSWRVRKQIVNEPCVIISPAGMLVGGASVFYSKAVGGKEGNGIAVIAYQAPETPGRKLLEEGLLDVKTRRKAKAEVRRFDFSAHSGREELLKLLLEDLKGDPVIVLVHGDEEPMLRFADELREKGLAVATPTAGQAIEV